MHYVATSPDPLAVAVGQAVRVAAARRGVKLIPLGARAGLTQRTMARRVNGHVPFTWPELVRIAEALDTDVADLLAEAEMEAARAASEADPSATPPCEVA